MRVRWRSIGWPVRGWGSDGVTYVEEESAQG